MMKTTIITDMTTQPTSEYEAMGRISDSTENPPIAEGFLNPESIVPIPEESSLASLVKFPGRTLSGIGTAIKQVIELHGNNFEPDNVERRTIPIAGHERVVLITEPDEEYAESSEAARKTILLPGLTEMDAGSALRLHQAMAARHPERLTATFTTPGVNHRGRTLSIREGLSRHPEETAAENLRMIKFVAKGGPVDLVGTSLGSHTSMLMAAQNLAANRSDQVQIDHVKLVAPAVGALNVPEHENFRAPSLNELELVDQAANDFFRHMLLDPAFMLVKHPERTAECAAIFGIYALAPHKFAHRAAAIIGNFTGVKSGIEWETAKDVACGTNLRVVGGERDPLMQATIDQWMALKRIAPDTRIAVVQGMGHAMTIAAYHASDYLAEMEGAARAA